MHVDVQIKAEPKCQDFGRVFWKHSKRKFLNFRGLIRKNEVSRMEEETKLHAALNFGEFWPKNEVENGP